MEWHHFHPIPRYCPRNSPLTPEIFGRIDKVSFCKDSSNQPRRMHDALQIWGSALLPWLHHFVSFDENCGGFTSEQPTASPNPNFESNVFCGKSPQALASNISYSKSAIGALHFWVDPNTDTSCRQGTPSAIDIQVTPLTQFVDQRPESPDYFTIQDWRWRVLKAQSSSLREKSLSRDRNWNTTRDHTFANEQPWYRLVQPPSRQAFQPE